MTDPTLPGMDNDPGPNPDTGIGGNKPPAYDLDARDALAKRTDAFLKASDLWTEAEVTETNAPRLADQISGLRKLKKDIESQRVKDKKPHDDAGAAVQSAYLPLIQRAEKSIKVLTEKMNKHLDAVNAAAEEERRKREAAARAAEQEARLKAAEAENSGNVSDQVAAEEAAKEAAKAEKDANRKIETGVRSATGAGRTVSQRTRNVVDVKNIRVLFLHYQDRPEVLDLLTRLATVEANAKGFGDGKIPGTIITKKTYTV